MTALKRIASYFEEFQRSVNDCRSADAFRPEHWKNAYGALGRLRDRYKVEKPNLTSEQQAALEKALENDVFFRGMMNARQVAEHVHQGDKPTMLVTSQNIPIVVKVSANALFSAPLVTLPDTSGEPKKIDHLQWLQEAEKRIKKALDNAETAAVKRTGGHG